MPYEGQRQIINVLCGLLVSILLILDAGAQAETKRILVLGDSLAAGLGLAKEQAFPARLEVALRAKGVDVKVINAGVSGDTTKGGRSRLGWVLADKPHFVLVELGGNDGLRGLDPKRTRANLDAIVTILKAKGIKVMIAGMLAPRNLGPTYGREFNTIYPQLAKKHRVPLYPFFLEGVALDPKLNQRDMIPPNRAGVAIIVERRLPHILKWIGESES